MNRKPRILIAAGGTGGHIFPAVAVAQTLRRQYDADIHFVGAKDGMEMTLIPKYDFPIKGLWIQGFHRGHLARNLLLPLKVMYSTVQAYHFLSDWKPDAIFALGAYVSVPVVWGRFHATIPVILHEPNAVPGLAIRLLAPKADLITLNLPSPELERYPHEYTGTPVRGSLLQTKATPEEARRFFGLDPKLPTVLVTGGSLGARTLNEAIATQGEQLLREGFQVIWQYGRQEVQQPDWKAYAGRWWVGPFIEQMDLAYRAADVVVSRAGASTVSELAVLGKPAVLVPSPYVADNHQWHNAKALADRQAAILVEDQEAAQRLIPETLRLLKEPERRRQLSEHIRQFGKPDAAERISRLIMQQIQKRRAA